MINHSSHVKPNVGRLWTDDENVPNAGQPVSSQSKDTHQQDQHRCSILNVVIQFTGDSTQTEKPDHLEWAEEAADTLKQKWNTSKKVRIF